MYISTGRNTIYKVDDKIETIYSGSAVGKAVVHNKSVMKAFKFLLLSILFFVSCEKESYDI